MGYCSIPSSISLSEHERWLEFESKISYEESISLENLNSEIEEGQYALKCPIKDRLGNSILKTFNLYIYDDVDELNELTGERYVELFDTELSDRYYTVFFEYTLNLKQNIGIIEDYTDDLPYDLSSVREIEKKVMDAIDNKKAERLIFTDTSILSSLEAVLTNGKLWIEEKGSVAINSSKENYPFFPSFSEDLYNSSKEYYTQIPVGTLINALESSGKKTQLEEVLKAALKFTQLSDKTSLMKLYAELHNKRENNGIEQGVLLQNFQRALFHFEKTPWGDLIEELIEDPSFSLKDQLMDAVLIHTLNLQDFNSELWVEYIKAVLKGETIEIDPFSENPSSLLQLMPPEESEHIFNNFSTLGGSELKSIIEQSLQRFSTMQWSEIFKTHPKIKEELTIIGIDTDSIAKMSVKESMDLSEFDTIEYLQIAILISSFSRLTDSLEFTSTSDPRITLAQFFLSQQIITNNHLFTAPEMYQS
jgi:hypothetical protein